MTDDARLSALRMLCNLDWRYLNPAACLELRGGAREVLVKRWVVEFLQTRRFEYKGAHHSLSAGAIDQILRELATLGLGDGLLAANQRLYSRLAYGVTVTEFMPDGKKHQPTIAIIDWDDPAANRFDVTEDLSVLSQGSGNHRAPDVVAYVNGIPLVVIECGRPTVREAIERHLRNQRDEEVPHLFAYAQLQIAIGPTDACYGTTRTPAKFWSRWNKEEEFDEAHVRSLKNATPPSETLGQLLQGKSSVLRTGLESLWASPLSPDAADRLLVSLLTPSRLLEVLRGFILFDRKLGKIVARPPQFFAAGALLKRLASLRADGSRKGGVVWHTAGSGKSLTMVFLAKALLLNENLKDCRIFVVTDRVDLEHQLARNFVASDAFGPSFGAHKEGERSKAVTGRDLARRIGSGTERITFALIQKFNIASRLPECRNESANIIVLVDEGHRSHGGETHERMRRALPRAAFVAFTGTPLLKDEKTTKKFGPIIHAYTMRRAVEDGVVTPLLYEERVPELKIDAKAVDRWFDKISATCGANQRIDASKPCAARGVIHGAAGRIELIAWDIATHFSENFKKLAPGLKGQVATASKRDAVRYKKALDATGLVTSAIVISPPDAREGDFDPDDDGLAEVQHWWRHNVLASAHKPAEHERQVLRGFGTDAEPDLLIVVDRLLTGFDEPRNAVLYIDKPLQSHGLIQAVARVNRLHDAKRHGLLVDYRGVLKQLDTAISGYQDLEERTQSGFDATDLVGLYTPVHAEFKRLPSLHASMWSFFDEVADRDDPEQLRQALSAGVRDDFSAAFNAFGQCLRTALSSRSFFEDPQFSEEQVARYKQDLRLLRNARQTAQRDAMESVVDSEYDKQIQRLVDACVEGSTVREPDAVYAVRQSSHGDAADAWPEQRARREAALIRTRLQNTIAHELVEDPYAQKVLSGLLKSAIEDAEALFDSPRKQYALFREFERSVDLRAVPGMPDVLSANPRARAFFGAILMALGDEAAAGLDASARRGYIDHALAVSRLVDDAMAEHSLDPQGFESAVRRDLLMRFHASLGVNRANAVISHVLQITRAGRSRSA